MNATGRFETIPTVRRPRSGLPNWALFGLAILLGIGMFSVLASQRQSAERNDIFEPSANSLIASPPPLSVSAPRPRPPEPSRVSAQSAFVPSAAPIASSAVPVRPPIAAAPERSYTVPAYPVPQPFSEPQPAAATSQPIIHSIAPAPALVLDRGVSRLDRLAAGWRHQQQAGRGRGEEAAIEDSAGIEILRPEPPLSGPTILAVGTVIPAILQTPVDTSRGGPVTAIVAQDVKGQDGSRVLVPKGAKLLGEYPAGADAAGKRVLINWTRLLLPNGEEVAISFPATDKNGAAGVKGDLHTNAFGRIAGSVLQTALNTATFGLLNRASSETVIIGTPSVAPNQNSSRNDRRRITVDAGEKIHVFVTQPIDFSPSGSN